MKSNKGTYGRPSSIPTYTLWKFQKEKSKKNGQKKVLNIQKK